ncbi:helix-turn-helix transcriptional regulator [Paraburkholderia sp. 2C]
MPSTRASHSSHSASSAHTLGAYLKDRRTKLDPAALGLPVGRRRTPGLRREEVAQRANVSATWYTWLEQGRGGAPSADVLDRIAQALMLTDVEREHLFLLGLGRAPEVRYDVEQAAARVSPRLQRILDSLELSPALVKTATWDIVAWNRAAAAVFEYGASAPVERNILRRIFGNPDTRAWQRDWESVARFVVAAFRADVLRAGATAEIEALVDELSRRSPEFESIWRAHDVRAHGEGSKHLLHPVAGPIELEFSSFAVDGRPELGMVIYTPVTPADSQKIRSLIAAVPEPLAQPS